MIWKFPINFMLIALFALTTLSCSEDKNEDNNSNNNDSGLPSQVSDPSELGEGDAEFATSGTESFSFTNATSTWRKAGSQTVNGRKYAATEVSIENADGDAHLTLTFYVHDTTANFAGGKLPEPGHYDVGLTYEEQYSEDTEAYASVSVWGAAVENHYDANTDSEGGVEITKMDGDVYEGRVDITGMHDAFGPDGNELNLAASFKAPEE